MAEMEWLCQIIGINPQKFTRQESFFLEANLFLLLYNELKKHFEMELVEYARLTNSPIDNEAEETRMEAYVVRSIIKELLTTENYTLLGISTYTHLPEDVIYDFMTGKNIQPSLTLYRKIIELHKMICPDLYRNILIKITQEYA